MADVAGVGVGAGFDARVRAAVVFAAVFPVWGPWIDELDMPPLQVIILAAVSTAIEFQVLISRRCC